ncbi:MAG: hypothetical protein QM734_12375 [Cyclobacteriaceae bacterium]
MKIIIGIVFIFICINIQAQKKRKSYPRIEISKVSDNPFDTLELVASVKSTYKCPPCPKGAQCKPCIGDHIEAIDGKDGGWIRLFTDEPFRYKVGKKYLFTVRFRTKVHRENNVAIVNARSSF